MPPQSKDTLRREVRVAQKAHSTQCAQADVLLKVLKFFYACLFFSITRSFALRARGFDSSSDILGTIGFLVIRVPSPALSHPTNSYFTILYSIEWNVITNSLPPGQSMFHALSKPSFNAPSSSFTAMRSAWKVLVAGCSLPYR